MAISADVPLVDSAFGKVQEGSPISYQHPVPVSRIVLFHPDAPPLPALLLDDYRLEPTSCQFVCSLQQQLQLQSLETHLEMARKIEVATREQSVSVEWHRVRRNRISYVDCTYLKLQSDTMKLKKQHRYYWQVQGQLFITGME